MIPDDEDFRLLRKLRRPSLGLGLGLTLGSGNSRFNPAILFANGEQGVWFDPADLSTVFQDSGGKTAGVVGQPVGLHLDKSKGLALGPELITPVANRDFSSDTGFWTKDTGVTIGGGAANWAATAATFQLFVTGFLTAGAYYEITYSITSYTAGGIRCAVGSTVSGTTRSAVGTYTERLSPDGTNLKFQSVGASTTLSIDNVSVKLVQGNHRYQTTAASRPTLQSSGGLTYLVYDGVDDYLVTNAIDFSASKQLTMWAGLKKLVAGVAVAIELSASVDSNDGAFNLASDATVSNDWYWSTGSSAAGQVFSRATTYTAPVTNVLSAAFDRSVTGSGQVAPRVNGAVPTLATAGTGSTSAFGSGYQLYTGRRGGASLAFTFNEYGLIIRGGPSTADQIAANENWLNTHNVRTY